VSNEVATIAIDTESGEKWFGTAWGLSRLGPPVTPSGRLFLPWAAGGE
jgi:hypothetical protein